MLITFLNKQIGTHRTVITDPLEYLISQGSLGFEEIYNQYNQLIITSEISVVNTKYISNYKLFLQPKLSRLYADILTFLQCHPDFTEHKERYYTEFKVKKRKLDKYGNVKWRKLVNPNNELKALQKQICDTLKVCGMIPHNAAHGFVEHRDFYTNAAIHSKSNHIINLDFKDFFDSITYDLVVEKLLLHPLFNVAPDEFASYESNYDLVRAIANIATYKGTTPQGSPLSPFLSNMVLVEFDYRIRKLLNNHPIKTLYTRYADDLSFSSKKSLDIKEIIHMVEGVLNQYYPNTIRINYEKTKKITPGQCYITGVKLNQSHELTVGWQKKNEIKSRIHNLSAKIDEFMRSTDEFGEEDLKAECLSVNGYLSFMHRVEPSYTNALETKYYSELQNINNFLNHY